jgi:hypothetical protein
MFLHLFIEFAVVSASAQKTAHFRRETPQLGVPCKAHDYLPGLKLARAAKIEKTSRVFPTGLLTRNIFSLHNA